MTTADKPLRTCILVLGMHRSGTSALAGVLNRLGVDIPSKAMRAHSMNEKGFFESELIWKMHENLLASAGSSWKDWRPINPSWFASHRADEFRERALAILNEEFGASRLFVLKDPRICRLMPFWKSVFEEARIAPVALHIHRNPLEVAASLNRRDGFDPNYSNLLWMRHVLEAEAGSRGLPRTFVSYPQLLEHWPKVLDDAEKALNLNFPRSAGQVADEIEAFLTPELRHHSEQIEKVQNNPILSVWLRDTLSIMERWSEGGEDAVDHASLDAIRDQFDATVSSFGALVQRGFEAEQRRDKDNEDQALKARVAELEAEAEKVKRAKALRDARLVDERQLAATQLAEAQQDAEARRAEVNLHKAEIESLARDRDQANERIAKLEADAQAAERARADGEARLLDERQRAVTALACARQETEAQQAEVVAHKAEIDALQSQVAHLESAYAQRSHEAEDWARRGVDLEQRLGESEAKRASLQGQLQGQVKLAREQAAERLVADNEMGRLRDTHTKTKADLMQAQERVETLEEARARDQKEAEARLAEVKMQKAEIGTLQSQVAYLESAYKQRRHEADDWARRSADLERRLGEAENQRIALKRELDERLALAREEAAEKLIAKAEIGRLREAHGVTDADLRQAREQLAKHDQDRKRAQLEVDARRAEVQLQEAEITALKHQVAQFEIEMAKLREAQAKSLATLRDAEARARYAATARQAMYESNSWRLTAPLRWVSVRLRRR